MFKSIIGALCIVSIVGCGIVKPNTEVTITQKCALVRNAATTAMFFGLQIVDVQDREAIAADVAHKVSLALSKLRDVEATPGVIVVTDIVALFNIDPKYGLFLQNAVDIFNTYFVLVPPSEAIGQDNFKLVVAFAEGVINGCRLVVDNQ